MVSSRGRNALRDLDYPALVLHEDALQHNIATMRDYCSVAGVLLAPHAKTSMWYEICTRQLDAGAWGLTAATPAQVRVPKGFGANRVVLANVLVDRASIAWADRELLADSTMDFVCYVDSVDGVRLLDETLGEAGAARLGVLVEIGYVGGRTGVRTTSALFAVARAVRGSGRLAFCGVAGFEGLLPTGSEITPPGLPAFLATIHESTRLLQEYALFDGDEPPIVTAGGSSYFDVVVDRLGQQAFDFPVRTVLRCGCYVTHDHGLYRRTSPLDGRAPAGRQLEFRPALELLASVWSRPEAELVIAGFGRRDAPSDDQLPVILDRYTPDDRCEPVGECEVIGLNDQHAYVRVPSSSDLGTGDRLSLGISHPCGALDRWRIIPLVNPQHDIVGEITTSF